MATSLGLDRSKCLTRNDLLKLLASENFRICKAIKVPEDQNKKRKAPSNQAVKKARKLLEGLDHIYPDKDKMSNEDAVDLAEQLESAMENVHAALTPDDVVKLTETFFNAEQERRMACEGPPDGPLTDGARTTKIPWIEEEPVVLCSKSECSAMVRALGCITIKEYNFKLLQLLCSWRKHINETKIFTRTHTTTICTSLSSWLGTKYDKGGILGIVANHSEPLTSVQSIYNLKHKPFQGEVQLKSLSMFTLILLGLKMNWTWSAKEISLVEPYIKKDKGTTPLKLLDLNNICPKIRYCLLSRAHFP